MQEEATRRGEFSCCVCPDRAHRWHMWHMMISVAHDDQCHQKPQRLYTAAATVCCYNLLLVMLMLLLVLMLMPRVLMLYTCLPPLPAACHCQCAIYVFMQYEASQRRSCGPQANTNTGQRTTRLVRTSSTPFVSFPFLSFSVFPYHWP